MFPRVVTRLPSRGIVRARQLSTHNDTSTERIFSSVAPVFTDHQQRLEHCCPKGGRQSAPNVLNKTGVHPKRALTHRGHSHVNTQFPRTGCPWTSPSGNSVLGKDRKARRRYSVKSVPKVAIDPFLQHDSDDALADDHDDKTETGSGSLPAAGLRPATAPASTPADLGCKAYYMAKTIDIKTMCTKLYPAFPRSFEKNCVVIGPLDPNCFEGGYPKPSDPAEGLARVLRDLAKLRGPGVADRFPVSESEEEHGRRPFVAPPNFTVDSPAYQARAWDMWEPGGATNSEQGEEKKLGLAGAKETGNSYVVLFEYGSVVFLHFSQQQQEAHLQRQRELLHEGNGIPPEGVKTETHGVVLWSTLPEPARLEPDCTTLRELDVNHITIIGTVLGQTVALDHYGDLVDSMMDKFVAINSGVEQTGKFTAAQKKELFQLVARNNTVRTDVISKLGILERSEAAWKDQDYNFVWEGLRDEFEMDSRLRKIESKLSMLQQNTNFFIEMLHNQKSTMLEWTIIVLIAAEIVVGVCDLVDFRPFSK